MKKENSKRANLMFYGNFVDADIQLEDLEDFLIDIGKFIEEIKNRLSSKKLSTVPINELETSKDYYEYTFGEIHRKSFIVTLCIFLELEIGIYCKEFQKQLRLDISWTDFKGSVLDRFRVFVNKLLKLKLNLSNTTQQDLQGIISLRNCIVHSNGCLENFSDAGKIRAFSNRYNSLIIDNNRVEISLKICQECVGIIRNFIELIYDCALTYFPGHYRIKSWRLGLN